LRHNFKGSTMLKNEQLHDTAITRKQGLVGSVMDYNPINLAPKGVKQGDYFTTTIGPYDYWAIEYAYKPLSGGTDGELDKLMEIAKRGAAPGNDYATDEDLYNNADPLVNQWDLGSDPMKYAQDRLLVTEELLKDLADRVVENGEGYQRVRHAFNMLMRQYADAAELITRFVGGEYMYRDHRGDPDGRDPFVPVKVARQREALKFLQEHFLTDKAFHFSPQLLRKLAADRWVHWGNEYALYTDVEYPLHRRILQIQQIVLDHMFDPDVLGRIQNNSLKCDNGDQPLTIAEVFRCMTNGIWSEFPPKEGQTKERSITTSIVRRNLQREHLKSLTRLVLGEKPAGGGASLIIILFGNTGSGSPPSDARSLARMHLRDIDRRIEATLSDRQTPMEDTTRAHLEACHERIAKVLSASVQVNEP
ncbi:MAG TPA: zinc-dependent metalloprotease, partial [Gemmataceae bacterium]|nr:zinc-dependent metalloprotease [Gemmataceae bacterium]